MLKGVLGILLAAVLVLNVWATYKVWRDIFSEPGQRIAQLALIWCLPFLGALLVTYLLRQNLEPASGRYPEKPEMGDDFGYLSPLRLPRGGRRGREEDESSAQVEQSND